MLYTGDFISEIGPGLATTDLKIKNAPEEVYRFLRATLKGYLVMYQNQEEALKFYMELQALNDLNAGREAWQARLQRTSESARTGIATEQAISDTIDQVKRSLDIGGAPLSTKELRPEAVYDFSFARRAIDELRAEKWDPKRYRYTKSNR
jgi:uncharacterized protein YerC